MHSIKKNYRLDSGQLATQLKQKNVEIINSLVLEGTSQFLSPTARISSNMIEFLMDLKILKKRK